MRTDTIGRTVHCFYTQITKVSCNLKKKTADATADPTADPIAETTADATVDATADTTVGSIT